MFKQLASYKYLCYTALAK